MEETKMEEARKTTVKRVLIYGVPYLKDRYQFVYKEKKKKNKLTNEPLGDLIGTLVNVRGKPTLLKKRVNLDYLTKSGKISKICTSLDTLLEIIKKYEEPDANEKKMVLGIYNKGLEVIKQIEDIKKPTVTQAYHFIRAVREVSVIQSLLTNQPLNMTPIMCACCRKEDFDSTFKKCGGCKCLYFCSSECNKLAWAEHKKNCKEMMCCEYWL